jgi:excisionase family DNA binding protein
MAETSPATATNQPPATPDGFIGKPEVARRLNKTIRTVDNWMKRGLLPYYKIGRSVAFKWSDVETHLIANCRVSRRGA